MRNNIEAMKNIRQRNEVLCVWQGGLQDTPYSSAVWLEVTSHSQSWKGRHTLHEWELGFSQICSQLHWPSVAASARLKRLSKAQKDKALLVDELKWVTFKKDQAGTEMQRLWKAQLSHPGAVSFLWHPAAHMLGSYPVDTTAQWNRSHPRAVPVTDRHQ